MLPTIMMRPHAKYLTAIAGGEKQSSQSFPEMIRTNKQIVTIVVITDLGVRRGMPPALCARVFNSKFTIKVYQDYSGNRNYAIF